MFQIDVEMPRGVNVKMTTDPGTLHHDQQALCMDCDFAKKTN
jgi:hypothetical protein